MGAWQLVRALNRDQRNTFIASFLGWTLDAFDYFILTFVVVRIAKDFNRAVSEIAFAVTLTLAMRFVGAFIFGRLADRFGRRIPLMADIIFYSVIELLTAFSPNYVVFLVLRALYGIGMGGEWGIGASLALEALPSEARGLFSGILQEGYSVGFILAAIIFAIIFPIFGWRGMFVIGVLPAFLVLFIRSRVPESPVWEQRRARGLQRTGGGVWLAIKKHWLLAIYAIVLMTAFNFMSHGSQDLYPTFLEKQRGYSVTTESAVVIILNIGAILGGIVFGYYSQRWGRRRSIIIAAFLGILFIPLWAFAPNIVLLAIGAFILQFMVQGAWGIIPVHLNEISPASARGTFPGFVYQLGNLISAPALQLQTIFAATFFATASGKPDYAKALAVVMVIVFAAVIILTAIGHEAKGIDFVEGDQRLSDEKGYTASAPSTLPQT